MKTQKGFGLILVLTLLGILSGAMTNSTTLSASSATTLVQTDNVWYVATNGTDNAGCGSSSSPCATVNYVLANKITAGDTIRMKAGTYNLSSTIIFNNVTNHANVTLTADDINNRPVLVGNCNWGVVIEVSQNVAAVTISYLEINHCPTGRILTWRNGIIRLNAQPATVDHCLLYNGFLGIGVNSGKNVILSNNVIHTMGRYETDPNDASGAGVGIGIYNFNSNPAATGWHEKIFIYNNEVYDVAEDGVIPVDVDYKYIEIAYNDFHHNYEDGIDLKNVQYLRIHHNKLHDNWGNGIGVPTAQYATDLEIYDNEIYNNGWYGIIANAADPGVKEGWKIWNNLIYGNCNNPATWGADGVALNGAGHEFYHNVVYNNTTPGGQSNVGIRGTGIIKDNVFYNNAPTGGYHNGNIASTVTGTIDHNYVYPTSPGITGANAVTDSDPQMTDPANGNFTLQSGSPLLN